jgi:hypothetical protein
MELGQAVLVTTEFRGVFFGKIAEQSKLPNKITLTNARNCIYWSSDCQGFLGLASTGVTCNCKIGKMVAEITLYKITSVTPVSHEAEISWLEA